MNCHFNVLRCLAFLALSLGAGFATRTHAATPADQGGSIAREQNLWPVLVRRFDATGKVEGWNAAGPLFFNLPGPEGGRVSGLRPVWLRRENADGDFRAAYFLYPLFSYTVDNDTYKWSLFELVRHTNRRPSAGPPRSDFDERGEFEIFPFWFYRNTGDPAMSYRGLFPIYGTVKNKLGFERLSWTLFPLYVENEQRGAVATTILWPIIRITTGAAHGFGVWPLFNYIDRPGVFRDEFYLWPLGFNSTRYPGPDAPPGTPPQRKIGALPFYARATGPGFMDESYLWPFFGYTDQTLPERYHERRYFWPFLVQGHGDSRYTNRWGPFYTHSIRQGYDKKWYLWPLLRRGQWIDTDNDLARTKTQFLYFIYWSQTQRSVSRPNSQQAVLRHLWPLYSSWDSGDGRKQRLLISPFEVFAPGNEKVRNLWTPLVALYRHDQRAPGEERSALLWNTVTWEKSAAEERAELHVGPLFSVESQAGRKRIAIGSGLFGFQRAETGAGWRPFWLDFRRKSATTSSSSR